MLVYPQKKIWRNIEYRKCWLEGEVSEIDSFW